MRREDIDFHLVRDEHLGIHQALENWARWVRVRPHGWQVSPMFAQYRSNWRQWHVPEIRDAVNIPEAVEMEKLVSQLPEKHRFAIRWNYVFRGNPAQMARFLGVTLGGLGDLVSGGRTMLRNRT
jgi:DNA-directed RNA polymerase specialized sigma24 family protein